MWLVIDYSVLKSDYLIVVRDNVCLESCTSMDLNQGLIHVKDYRFPPYIPFIHAIFKVFDNFPSVFNSPSSTFNSKCHHLLDIVLGK